MGSGLPKAGLEVGSAFTSSRRTQSPARGRSGAAQRKLNRLRASVHCVKSVSTRTIWRRRVKIPSHFRVFYLRSSSDAGKLRPTLDDSGDKAQ